jgi:hypothetical protein
MKETYTLKELAAIMGLTVPAIHMRAAKEHWPFREVPNERGGGTRKLFETSSLPPAIQQAIQQHLTRALASETSASSDGIIAAEGVIPGEPAPGESSSGTAAPVTPTTGALDGIDPKAVEIWRRLPAKEKAIALARLEVLRAADAYAAVKRGASRARVARLEEFYRRMAEGIRESDDPDILRRLGLTSDRLHDVRTHIKAATIQTDYRWRSEMARAKAEVGLGILGLVRTQRAAPGYGSKSLAPEVVAYARDLIRKGDVKIFPQSRDDAGRVIRLNASNLFRRLTNQFKEENLPSYAHFTKWLNAWLAREQEGLCAIVLPSFWRATFGQSAGCAGAIADYAGQVWELDGTRADVMLQDGRHEIIAAIDIYSRDVVFEIQKNASAITVAKLLFGGIARWGRPEKLIVDNGSIFIADHIQSACEALEIDMHRCRGYSPGEKPHIESFMNTLAKMLWENMTWFIGHDPKQRRRIDEYNDFSKVFCHHRGEKISCSATADEFRKVVNDWIEKVYRAEEHDFADAARLGRPRTIPERLSGSPQRARKVSNPEALEMLLSPSFERVFDSGIRWIYGKYQPADIPSWERAQRYGQQNVLFRPLLSDVGRGAIWEIRQDGRIGELICYVTNEERSGQSLADFQAAKKNIQKRHRDRRRAVEELAGPQSYEAELAAMPAPKLAVGNFGAVEWEGESYRNLVEYKDTGSRIPKKPAGGWLNDEARAKLGAELREKDEIARRDRESEAGAQRDRAAAKSAPNVLTPVFDPPRTDVAMNDAQWDEIRGLRPDARYERILELEARRIEIPADLKRDARYFESDPAYERLKGYFERKKAQFAMVYKR